MIRKKVAILGASYLQYPLFEKAKEMQIETHCFAWDDGAVCKEIADFFYPISVIEKELILQKCIEIGIDGILTIATDLAIPTIAYVAEKLNLIGNSYLTSILATNKIAMRKAFQQNGCKIPLFREATLDNLVLDRLIFPLIVKPADSSGSRGVTKVFENETLQLAIQNALAYSKSNRAIVEEFIEGEEISVETISKEGKHYVLAITDKETTGEPNFVELAHHQPSKWEESLLEEITEKSIQCLNALGITNGAGHLEFKITDSREIYVIEVGARMGGDFIGSHLVKLSTGYDFLKGVLEVVLDQFEIPQPLKSKYAGVYFLSKETSYLKPYFYKKNTFEVKKEIFTDELKSITNSNDRSGYLIYQSSQKINLV